MSADHRSNLLAAGALYEAQTGNRVVTLETWCARHGRPDCAECREEEPPSEPTASPVDWDAIRRISERARLLTDASMHLYDRECSPGDWCDQGSKCARHELTPAAAELAVDLLPIVQAALRKAGVDGPTGAQFVDDAFAAMRRALLRAGDIE